MTLGADFPATVSWEKSVRSYNWVDAIAVSSWLVEKHPELGYFDARFTKSLDAAKLRAIADA